MKMIRSLKGTPARPHRKAAESLQTTIRCESLESRILLNAVVLTGHKIALKIDANGQAIDAVIDGQSLAPMPFSTTGSLVIHGRGGSKDAITFDFSGGNILKGSTTIDDRSGSEALRILGGNQNDHISIGPKTLLIGSASISMSNVRSVTYTGPGGNDSINLSGAIPATLNLASGNSTITNSDSSPVYVAASTGKTTINATAGTTIIPANSGTGIQQLDFAAINISAGAKVVFANSSSTLGDYSHHANRTVAVIDAGGLNVATGGTLDLGDNDMILNYSPANEAAAKTQVFNLLASGITTNGDWTGTGITSSEAAYDTNVTGTRALGMLDNADIGYSSFDGVTLADTNQILVKFTYYGDADLTGTMNGVDLSQYFAGRSHQGTGWDFADFDYDGVTGTPTDLTLYFSGANGYKQFGAL